MTTDNDKTRLIQPHEPKEEKHTLGDGTVLSATEVESFKTQHTDPDATAILTVDDDATQIVTDETRELTGKTEATVLAGATEALKQPTASFTPRVGPGSIIKDRFTLEKLLGRGGMGEVYLASDKRKIEAQDKNPYVAFKVLGENFKRHPQAFIALQREARKTQELAHPNIVTVYDFDRQGDAVYITMEALSGKPMDEEIRADVRPIADAINLITQCASGLAYAHKKGLVHSDLKPGNLFLTADGTVKLLDFGIARAFKSGKDLEANKNTKDDTVFDAGELGALTPAYASFEMIQGEEPHPSDDVYAMGLIAYELLTGKHPFNKQMATKALEQGLKPERVKGLTKIQWRAIEEALAFKREDRIQDAQEFLSKFTAKSKTPLIIASTFILAAFITVGSMYFLKEAELGPDIPFTELPIATQQKVTQYLDDAKMAMQFDDYNGALMSLDMAFTEHKYNPEVMLALDDVVNSVIESIAALDQQQQLDTINSVIQYEALKTNKKLLKHKEHLTP
jgi:serine/threonine protein kinase